MLPLKIVCGGQILLAFGDRLLLVKLMALCELSAMTVMVCKNQFKHTQTHTDRHTLSARQVTSDQSCAAVS